MYWTAGLKQFVILLTAAAAQPGKFLLWKRYISLQVFPWSIFITSISTYYDKCYQKQRS